MGKKTVPHLGRSPGIDRKHGDGTLWNRLWRFLSSREDDWRLCSLPETLRLSVPRAADVIGYVSTDWSSAKSSKGFGRWSCRGLPSTWYLLMFPDNAGFWCSSYSKARVTCGDTKWLCLQIGYPRSTGLSLFSQLKWPFGGYHVFRLTGKCSVSVGEEGRGSWPKVGQPAWSSPRERERILLACWVAGPSAQLCRLSAQGEENLALGPCFGHVFDPTFYLAIIGDVWYVPLFFSLTLFEIYLDSEMGTLCSWLMGRTGLVIIGHGWELGAPAKVDFNLSTSWF